MKRRVVAERLDIPGRDYFSVRYEGQVYDDAWKDTSGHIWFGDNVFEYVPQDPVIRSRHEHVNVHGFRPTGNGAVHTCRKSSSKIEIFENNP